MSAGRDYRVVFKEGVYAIYEVFFNARGDIYSVGDIPEILETKEFGDLRSSLELMIEALSKPVIIFDDLELSPWVDEQGNDVMEDLEDMIDRIRRGELNFGFDPDENIEGLMGDY